MDKTTRNLILLVVIAAIIGAGAIITFSFLKHNPNEPVTKKKLPTFSSCEELRQAFNKRSNIYPSRWGAEPMIMDSPVGTSGGLEFSAGLELGQSDIRGESVVPREKATAYSTTNVQVQGIDEADIVKTDGEYIYTISNKNLNIVKAFPAKDAELVARTELDLNPQEMFIDNNYLLIFGTTSETVILDDSYEFYKNSYYEKSKTFTTVEILNISNKNNPKKVRAIDFEGDYRTARKIDDQVYFVINSYPNFNLLENEHPSAILPLFRDRDYTKTDKKNQNNFYPSVLCTDIAYINDVNPNQFTTVASISLKNASAKINQEVILGSASNVYASFNNLYLAEEKYDWDRRTFFDEEAQYTVIHTFGLDQGEVWYRGYMEAPGQVLNQFSMDEYNDYFRLATTRQNVSTATRGQTSTNNIYIFDKNLYPVGSLEDLAPGETIYSARFIDDRAYLVTFKQMDPFFVIDLSDPKKPKALGELKIPGFSDYLHPYDENHIIGIGKDTTSTESTQVKGLKMALFDVNDVTNPKEIHKVVIGDQGTDSYALRDHKAFLFDREKDLLVLPIRLFEPQYQTGPEYAKPSPINTFQGSYVYNLTISNGFELKGRITHYEEALQPTRYYNNQTWDILRNLYIDNNLYSISDGMIKINNLADLSEIKAIKLEKVKNDPVARARDARRLSDIKMIQTGLQMYLRGQDSYPVLDNSIVLGSSQYNCLDQNGFHEQPCHRGYIQTIPSDPKNGQYIYTNSIQGTTGTYAIVFTLETIMSPYNGKNCVASPDGISCN